jgi:phosphoglycolate phosphatase-like HAD superfamily hydrolase
MVLFISIVIPLTAYGSDAKPLSSWTADSLNKHKIIAFVEDITNTNSKNFVPVQDRIAVFDMDGTIVCEEPLWLELAVAEYKILTDMRDNKELVEKVNRLNMDLKQNPEPPETGQLIEEVTGEAFKNVSQEDFVKYMESFMKLEKPEFMKLSYKDSFYKPMLEIISYLIDNKFQVYIASGSERGVIWGACRETLASIPRSHEIGADIVLKPLYCDDPTNSNYVFGHNDELIRQTGFTQKDLKLWKVYNIYHQIGSKPILAFGNTDGDFSMLNYAKSNKQYKSMSFLLCHDDAVREFNYNTQQRDSWNNEAEKQDWNVIFMSKEFKQIFMKETKKLVSN